jgi:hypothetical protein
MGTGGLTTEGRDWADKEAEVVLGSGGAGDTLARHGNDTAAEIEDGGGEAVCHELLALLEEG